MLNPFVTLDDLTSPRLTTSFDDIGRIAYQAADSAPVVNTTVVPSTDLIMSIDPFGLYLYEAMILYTSGTASDFTHRLSDDTGRALFIGVELTKWTSGVTGTTISSPIEHDEILSDMNSGGAGTGNIMATMEAGLMGAAIGQSRVSVWYAQATLDATTAVVLKQGSWIRLTRID